MCRQFEQSLPAEAVFFRCLTLVVSLSATLEKLISLRAMISPDDLKRPADEPSLSLQHQPLHDISVGA